MLPVEFVLTENFTVWASPPSNIHESDTLSAFGCPALNENPLFLIFARLLCDGTVERPEISPVLGQGKPFVPRRTTEKW